jgi:UDP-N-acetylglucosamine 2-epimerase (non-hydrolysing)
MESRVLETLGLREREYALLTLHRPSNVDDPKTLGPLLETIDEIAKEVRIVFPVHPRTRARIAAHGITLDPSRWTVVEPLGYLDFLKLTATAKVVLTDSGGIQVETTVLGVPCITLRENTERPVTITEGTNVLAGTKREAILAAYERFQKSPPPGRAPRFWDGKSAARIDEALSAIFR